MSERAYDIWIYDQELPNERCYSEGRLNIPKPSFLLTVQDKRTEEEKEKSEDEYLKKHGI